MKKLVIAIALMALLAAACSSIQKYPYPACLFDEANRYDRGSVIARRDSDDAQLFAFADPTKGDEGFQWVKPGGSRTIRRCREATMMDAAAAPPMVPFRTPEEREP